MTFLLIGLAASGLAWFGFRPKSALAADKSKAEARPAIVLAAFGTSEPLALKAIQNIVARVRAAFPGYEIKLAFTSGIIRRKWRSRLDDAAFKKANPDLADDFYQVKSPLTTMALLREDGPREILVQPLHLTNGEEYADLRSVVKGLAGMTAVQAKNKPFPRIALGQSVFGPGRPEELRAAAQALEPLVERARGKKAALVLMGHGSPSYSNKVYGDFERIMNETYNYPVFLGLVDGEPALAAVVEKINRARARKAAGRQLYLAPLMLVAGEHARHDLAGPADDSWASVLAAAGYQVEVGLEGLGGLDRWADIYISRLREIQKAMLH